MSSGNWFPVHKNKCFVIKGVRLSDVYLGLDNENVYSIHTFLLTCWLYCSTSFCIANIYSVHLVCRSQTRQTLTTIYSRI